MPCTDALRQPDGKPSRCGSAHSRCMASGIGIASEGGSAEQAMFVCMAAGRRRDAEPSRGTWFSGSASQHDPRCVCRRRGLLEITITDARHSIQIVTGSDDDVWISQRERIGRSRCRGHRLCADRSLGVVPKASGHDANSEPRRQPLARGSFSSDRQGGQNETGS